MKRDDLLFKIKRVKDTCFNSEYDCVILPIITDKIEKLNELKLFTSIGEVITVDLDKIEVYDIYNIKQEVIDVFNDLIQNEKERYKIELDYLKAYERFNELKQIHNNNKKAMVKLYEQKKLEVIDVQDYLSPKEVEEFLSNNLKLKNGYSVSVIDGLYNSLTYTHSINLLKEIPIDISYKNKDFKKETEIKCLINKEFIESENINTNTFYLKSVVNIDEENELNNDNEVILFNNISISFKRVNHTLNELNVLVELLNNKL